MQFNTNGQFGLISISCYSKLREEHEDEGSCLSGCVIDTVDNISCVFVMFVQCVYLQYVCV